jgi:hypothetical protein
MYRQLGSNHNNSSAAPSRHMLFIEQDGKWIKGAHKGDFTVRELTGEVESDTSVKMKSTEHAVIL